METYSLGQRVNDLGAETRRKFVDWSCDPSVVHACLLQFKSTKHCRHPRIRDQLPSYFKFQWEIIVFVIFTENFTSSERIVPAWQFFFPFFLFYFLRFVQVYLKE